MSQTTGQLGTGTAVADARTAFLADDPVPAGVVAEPILASWTRSRRWHVRPDHLTLPYQPDVDGDEPLARSAAPVLAAAADLFASEPVSILLCDLNGVVLTRRTSDTALAQHLDRVWLAPGFSYAERFVGTNGIGTALEGRGPVHVVGHEHFTEHLEELACAGVPVRHPITGKVVGVLDLTGWTRHSGALLVATAVTLAHRVEAELLTRATSRQVALLQEYLIACRRHHGPVLAVADDLVMVNGRARELLDPGDQAPLLAGAADALATGRRSPVVVDLPSGRTARVQCHPVDVGPGAAGVLVVQLAPAAPRSAARPQRPASETAVGSSAVWTGTYAAVERQLRSHEWVVLDGEPGVGKEALVRAVHHRCTPAARLTVLRAEEAGPGWAAAVADELTGGGTLLIEHVDRLPERGVAELVDELEPWRESTDPARAWVVATTTGGGSADGPVDGAPDLAPLLACFPRTLPVPPLRQHLEDVPQLVPHLVARLTRGSVTCAPEVVRVLTHHRWPGNVAQLQRVLREVVATRRSGRIELRDLPAECWVTTRRVLTPLESLECDAIIRALVDADGSKAGAARRLSMSRATIYRKVRDYGIAVDAATAGAR